MHSIFSIMRSASSWIPCATSSIEIVSPRRGLPRNIWIPVISSTMVICPVWHQEAQPTDCKNSHSLVPRASTLSLSQSSPTSSQSSLHRGHPTVSHSLHHPCCHALAASSSLPHLRCPTLVASSSLPYPRCTILLQLVFSTPITLLALINRLCRCSYVLKSGRAALKNHRGGCRTPNPLANFCR